MKERLLEVIDLLNREKEDLDQLCKDVSFPETTLARSAAMTNRRVREILEEVLENIENE
jgi:predicted regulator of amino acid metabolism with ACT domain